MWAEKHPSVHWTSSTKTKVRSAPAHEIADILNGHSNSLHLITNNSWKLRTLHAIRKCRTAALGGHIDKCDHKDCGVLHLSYNSCRNRHCPKCQGHLREQWVSARENELINVPYFHAVFTLPQHLNGLCLQEPAKAYGILMKTAWETIRGFAAEPKFLGASTGMVSVLHTWGQNMSLHPHVHCIIPGGGLTKSGKWKHGKNKGKFLFPVKAMSKVFRAKFMAALRKEFVITPALAKKLMAKPWVVYCKRPFAGPKQVLKYLGRYTHKIAISNHRIRAIDQGLVSFAVKDYRHGGKNGLCKLSPQEFIRRFSMHILPKGFVRIRHYGLLSSSSKAEKLALAKEQAGSVEPEETTTKPLFKTCPRCKKGNLITVAVFEERGPPGHWIKRIKEQQQKKQRQRA